MKKRIRISSYLLFGLTFLIGMLINPQLRSEIFSDSRLTLSSFFTQGQAFGDGSCSASNCYVHRCSHYNGTTDCTFQESEDSCTSYIQCGDS